MVKKLFFILILFSVYAKHFAQNNPFIILENKDPEPPQKSTKTTLTKQKKGAYPYPDSKHNNTAKKDTVNHQQDNTSRAIEIGAGGLYTSLNFFKNAQAFTYYPALSTRLYLQPNNFIRFVIDYSKVQQVNIAPTWLNVQNTYLDLDAHFLLHPANAERTTVYFVLGLSSQFWHGIYTGIDDYNHYVLHVQKNTDYKTTYFGGSIGVGFEFKLVDRIKLYGEVRYRLTQTDVGFGLSDVCYGAGVKCTLFDFRPKPVYAKPSKHFHWF